MRLHRLRMPLLAALLLSVLAATSHAAGAAAWQPIAARPSALLVATAPALPQLRLDAAVLRAELAAAPLETDTGAAKPVVEIPGPDGAIERFAVAESPVMAPALAAKVPQFKSYTAVGIDDPTASGRIDLSPLGFHATLRSDSAAWNVDPESTDDAVTHVVSGGLRPDVKPEGEDESDLPKPPSAKAKSATTQAQVFPAAGSQVVLHTYRLALASDPTFADAIGVANVDAYKAAIVNRADQIYNDDLAIRLVLVANNNLVDFNTASQLSAACGTGNEADCYQPDSSGAISCDGAALDANQLAIDHTIGDANYDIGHIATGADSGGLAGEGVGQTGYKSTGCTGSSTPTGDGFAIDYFTHEVGHQFGADHTFNGALGACAGGNRNTATSVEPGSGSSIMGYASICGADDLQRHADPYFNHKSIEQIEDYITRVIPNARNGGTQTTTADHSPVVTVPSSVSIPPRTPFTLSGSASDADGNSLVYMWEQDDASPSSSGTKLISNTKTNGPLFRMFSTASLTDDTDFYDHFYAAGEAYATEAAKTRTFPDYAQIAAGNTNAATGSCPAASNPVTQAQVDCYSEFLPTSARTMHFSLVARDRVGTGGGVSEAKTTVTVSGSAPFRVTAPANAASVTGGTQIPITWDVAGTDTGLGVASVSITYSTDGGLSFPTTVLASTPNDGAETVTVPVGDTTQGRFKVQAVGQPFFDTTHVDLTVAGGTGPTVMPTPITTPEPTPTPFTAVPGGPTPTPVATATPAPPQPTPAPVDTGAQTPAVIVAPAPTVAPTPVLVATTFRPVLTALPTKTKPSKKGVVSLKLSCALVNPAGVAPALCAGSVKLTVPDTRKGKHPPKTIASSTFSLPKGAAGSVTLKVNAATLKSLKKAQIKATLVATVGTSTAQQPLKLSKL